MLGNNTILAVITARGGSRRLPDKNIMDLSGKPLIAWTIEASLGSRYIDRTILSSDSQEIIRKARRFGCEVPFVRPSSLSTDTSTSADVVLHAIESIGKPYDYIVLLQPTSPLRTSRHIDSCIEKCIYEKADTAVSVVKTDKSPLWTFIEHREQLLPAISGEADRNIKGPFYILNGAVYVVRSNWFIRNRRFVSEQTAYLKMEKNESVDIDDLCDFKLAEILFKMNQDRNTHGTSASEP